MTIYTRMRRQCRWLKAVWCHCCLVLALALPAEITSATESALWPSSSVAKNLAGLAHPEQKIALNFTRIELRSVLQLLADYQGLNLVVSDAVEGEVTLHLKQVSWSRALAIILQLKDLEMRIIDDVMLIAPGRELAERARHNAEHTRQAGLWGELHTEILTIHYARAADIGVLLGGEKAVNMLSERGTLSVDERTNTLLVRDLAGHIAAIRDMVRALDVPVRQVQIEARIVSVNEGDLDELGVRWGFHSAPGHGRIGASLESNVAADGRASDDTTPTLEEQLNINLAATSVNASTIAFQVAKLGADTLLDLELSALQRESKAEIISSPRLVTTNQQPAFIEQGTEIPYLESSSSGATSVAFKKAVLSLKVTPQITPDNRLVLDLNVTQDRPGEVVQTGTGEAVAINTQRIGTQVLVNDGETVVLGGIYQHSVSQSVDKVPLLGDLPWLGPLFRRSYQQTGKGELLIFVTPKVVIQ